MLMTKENLDIWYREYKKQFERSTKYSKSRGGTTRGLTPLTRAEFQMDFISETFDNPKLSGKQVAQRMAKQEVFPQSYAQATRHAEAHVREFGGKLTPDLISKYRIQSENKVFEAISNRRYELQTKGLSASEIKLTIGQEFYGSV